MKHLALTLLLASCGPKSDPTAPEPGLADVYEAVLTQHRADFEGEWPSETDCDGLLWAGLAKSAGWDWVDVSRGVNDLGRPFRRPTHDCYQEFIETGKGGSRSTTSNDMVLGALWGIERDDLVRLWDYARWRDWVIGEPWPEMAARVYLKPNPRQLIATTLGDEGSIYYGVPPTFAPVEPYYAKRLQVIQILYWERIGRTRTPHMDRTTVRLAKEHPDNALFQCAALDRDRGSKLLLDPEWHPPGYSKHFEHIEWLFAAKVCLGV